MNVEKHKEKKEITNPILLKNVPDGEIIRFSHTTFEEALKEDLFYYVLSKKDKRVKLICLSNAEQIERDEVWRVFKHDAVIQIVQIVEK